MGKFKNMSEFPKVHPDDPYKIQSMLAEGSRSRVYLAEDSSQGGKLVAIKFLRPEAFSGATVANDNLSHEAQCLGLAAHPNVVAKLGTNTNADGQMYLVMEYVKGKLLKDLLKEPLDLSIISTIFLPLTHALENSHKVGVVHADLRPDKIIIELADKKVTPKLFGFGRAKFLPWSGRENSLELPHKASLYALQYSSSEEAMGKRCLPTSDVYSLGLIMYEALSGQPAVTGENELHLMTQHLSGTAQPPSVVRNDPSIKKFDEVIMQTITKETHRRFVDFAEFREALSFVAPAQSGGWLSKLFKR
jgi:serine/threonine protein kinase